MTLARLVLLTFAAVIVPGAVDDALPEATAPAPIDPAACELTAIALREAAQLDAQAELWRNAAKALNGPEAEILSCLQWAWTEYTGAVAASHTSFDARLLACAELGHGAYHPMINPASFTASVTNTFFPLVVGHVQTYEQHGPEGLKTRVVTVLDETAVISGVSCRAVRTVDTVAGVLQEEDTEWFAQHASGAVWFFGAVEKHFHEGFLDSLGGSWRAGRHEAQAGTLMPAVPTPGAACRMAYLPGLEEDIIKVVALNQTVVTAGGTYTGCVQIEEYSPLEDEREIKYFAPGIGLVLEINPATGERTELVATTN